MRHTCTSHHYLRHACAHDRADERLVHDPTSTRVSTITFPDLVLFLPGALTWQCTGPRLTAEALFSAAERWK